VRLAMLAEGTEGRKEASCAASGIAKRKKTAIQFTVVNLFRHMCVSPLQICAHALRT